MSFKTYIYLILLVIITIPVQSFAASYAKQDYQAYKATSFSNSSWDSYVKQGFEALDSENIQGAVEALRQAHNLGTESPLVLFKLALAYEALGSYYSAIQYYELAQQSFKKANKNHRYYKHFDENYGRALYLMGQKEKALPILQKAVQTSNSPWLLKLMGNISIEQNEPQAAQQYFERLLQTPNNQLNPEETFDIYLLLARLYRNLEDSQASIQYYKKVLEMDPSHPEAKEFVSFSKTQKTDNSNPLMDKVIKMFQNH